MPRTFTLQSLMVGITLFCIVCGLAAAFPQVAIGCTLLISFFVPGLIVWMVLAGFSRRPLMLLTMCLGGVFLGLFILCLFITPSTPAWAPLLLTSLGALIFGCAELADDMLARRQGR